VTKGGVGSRGSGERGLVSEIDRENDILMCNENLIYHGNSHFARASNNSFFS
jgi:hypothetical protein